MSEPGRRAFAAVLVALLALIVGEGRARAEGIVVSGTTLMPTGDPMTIVDFYLTLSAGSELINGDSLTIMGIPTFESVSFVPNPSLSPFYASLFQVVSTPEATGGLTDVTLEYSPVAPPPTIIFQGLPGLDFAFGYLQVVTSTEFPPSGDSPLVDPFNYESKTHDTSGNAQNSGLLATPSANIVPEPASMALVGAGLALGGLVSRRRRRA